MSPTAAAAPQEPSVDLVSALRDLGGPIASRRERARARLAEEPGQARHTAARHLDARDRSVRVGAAAHLAESATPAEAPALLATLAESDRSDPARAHVIAALGRSGTPECVSALVRLLDSDDAREAAEAGRALAGSGADLPRGTLHAMAGMGNPVHTRTAALTALGPTALPEEQELFTAAAFDLVAAVRWSAARGLARLSPATDADLERLSGDDDDGVRLAVLDALLVTGGDVAARLAEGALDDPEGDNRVRACEVLARHPGERSFDRLLAIVTDPRVRPYVRTAAIRALVAVSPERAEPPLRRLVESEPGAIARACLAALSPGDTRAQ